MVTGSLATGASLSPLATSAVARLVRMPQSAASVVPVTVTLKLSPAPRSTGPQARTSLPTAPVIAQPASTPVVPVIVQSTPGGRSSVMVTSKASPGPSLPTVIVNEASSPASIGLAAASFAIVTVGQSTLIAALSVFGAGSPAGSLAMSTVALLVRIPQ